MPFTKKDGTRDYRAELAWEKKNKPYRVKDRAKRNSARKEAGLTVGDGMHADHKKELSSGGSNKPSNVRKVKASTNLKKEAERKKKAK